MKGEIIRIERSVPGAFIPNATAHDSRLKLDTLGLLTWLLAHGDGWTIMMGPLIDTCSPRAPKAHGGGRDWVRRMVAELEAAGYVRRTRTHAPDGTWDWQSVVSDVPMGRPTIDGSAVDGSATDGHGGDISPITPRSNDLLPSELKSRARSARKSTPAIEAGGGESDLELETNPVLAAAVGNLVQAVRHGPCVRNLRSLVIAELSTRGVRATGTRISQIIAAVNSRAPVRRGDTQDGQP